MKPLSKTPLSEKYSSEKYSSESSATHFVVTNRSGRESCWPASRAIPAGWVATEFSGTRQQCLEFIRTGGASSSASGQPEHRLDFSLMFFGDSEQEDQGDRYRLLLDASQFADRKGFRSVWLPERHFTALGCLYPSPAVLHAAIARETEHLRLCAGSVVMPLNDPIRVAEQWAVVDNLSGGRVEVAFASGWHADDFVLMPNAYECRSESMFDGIRTIQTLWQGESIARRNGAGDEVSVRTYPTPIQDQLPVWLTAAGNPETFRKAGSLGFGVLTHLFNQDFDSLQDNIRTYRSARADAGHEGPGKVAVTLHTFVGKSAEQVRQLAGQAYCDYLMSNLTLLKQLAFSHGQSVDLASLSEQELDEMTQWLLDKYIGGRSLMGSITSCVDICRELSSIGVGEIVCLMDFGPKVDLVLEHLSYLAGLVDATRSLVVAQ